MELLTVKETARLLRVSPITIRRYIASGRLAAERVGRGIRVRREALEDFVTPIAPNAETLEHGSREEPVRREGLGIGIGISRSGEPTSFADRKDEYLADAVSVSSSDEEGADPAELLGEPFTKDDPLWDIVGIGRSDGPNDVARNKHRYLAEAILSHKLHKG